MHLKVNVLKKLWFNTALACALVLLVWPLQAHTKKGDKLLKEGDKAEQNKDYDTALSDFEQALDTDSKEPAYLIAVNRVRTKAAEADVRKGRTLQQQQKLDEALVEFQKALLADPSYQVALQEIRITNDMIRDKAKAPPGTVILTPAERARRDVEKRINSLEGAPTLRPINDQISSLKMNNQPPRVLYESVCKLAGINALFDPSGIEGPSGAHNVNLDLHDVTLDDALNYVALVTHTFWQPISHNAIFVTQDVENKRREYQNEVVKVFYVQNVSTPSEFQEIYNGVRIGAKLQQGIFQVASQYAIVARGSPDTIALVEKLIHDLDRPKPEVLVDVVVMEVSKSKITTLGAALAGQTGGLNIPILYNPRNPVTVGGSTGTTTGTTVHHGNNHRNNRDGHKHEWRHERHRWTEQHGQQRYHYPVVRWAVSAWAYFECRFRYHSPGSVDSGTVDRCLDPAVAKAGDPRLRWRQGYPQDRKQNSLCARLAEFGGCHARGNSIRHNAVSISRRGRPN